MAANTYDAIVIGGGHNGLVAYLTRSGRFTPARHRYPAWKEWLGGVADVLAPLLLTVPPRLGSRHPEDLLDQLRLLWRCAGSTPIAPVTSPA